MPKLANPSNGSSSDYWPTIFAGKEISAHLFSSGVSGKSARMLFKEYVSVINLEVFSLCNRVCSYCPDSLVDRHSTNSYMSEDVFNSILTDLVRIQYDNKVILNLYNEPLADYDFLCKRISEIRKNIPNAKISFNSNGDYITNEKLSQLSKLGISSIFVTLHPSANVKYEDEDRLSHFKRFFKRLNREYSIEDFKTNRHFSSSFSVNSLLVEVMANNHELYGNSRGGTLNLNSNHTKKEIWSSEGKQLDLVKLDKYRQWPCTRPFREFTVYHTGEVYPCCNIFADLDTDKKNMIGNVGEGISIFELYASAKLSSYRLDLIDHSEKKSPCDTCFEIDTTYPEEGKKIRQNIKQNAASCTGEIIKI
jgi:radical SAM protein with 4Fe4S-binding SPASM domain